jgi:hypothetical protein
MGKKVELLRKFTVKKKKNNVEILPSSIPEVEEIKKKLNEKNNKLNQEQIIKKNIEKREQEKKVLNQIKTQQDREDERIRDDILAMEKRLRENKPFYKAIEMALKNIDLDLKKLKKSPITVKKSKSSQTLYKKNSSKKSNTPLKQSKSKDSFDSILKLY